MTAQQNRIISIYQISAAKRGYEWSLTDEQAVAIMLRPCRYCAAPPGNSTKYLFSDGDWSYSGIDRVNSDLGYTTDNCVPCCKWCNYAKRDRPLDAFREWVAAVYNNQASSCW